jgi:hypothetical protein
LIEKYDRLQREMDVAVQVLMQAVVVTDSISEEERSWPRLPGLRTTLEQGLMLCGPICRPPESQVPVVCHRCQVAIEGLSDGVCAFRPWRTVDPGMTDSPGAKRRKLGG